ncbi:MAG: glycosyltransferase family 4 protein [Solirubrobacterales bacterium]
MVHNALKRLGINAVFLEPGMGGVEVYARALVGEIAELRPDVAITVFANRDGAAALAREGWATAGAAEIVTHPLLGRRYARALTELTLLGALASSRRLDVLHSLAMVGPLRTRAATVVTVHDLIWHHHPESMPASTTRLWKAAIPRVVRASDRIIAPSAATRDELVAAFGTSADRVDVVPQSFSAGVADPTPAGELRRRFSLGDGPVVYCAASAKKSHKNLELAIDAMPQVHKRVAGAQLVISGHPTAHEQVLRRRISERGIRDAIVLVPWISRADVEGMYELARCFVFPSRSEGFGLPPLEAMRRGLPVVSSNVSAVGEVVGDAALTVSPDDVNGLAGALERVLTDKDLASRLIGKGRRRAAQFSWRHTAELTLDSYDRTLKDRGRHASAEDPAR